MNKETLTIKGLRDKISSGIITAEKTIVEYLAEAEAKNPKINAYISIRREKALAEAKQIDKEIKSGKKPGSLCGVPMAIKDNILMEGEVCTSGSKIIKDYASAYDATVIKKLKEAGAIIIGKANMDEFAMGSSTENSAFGIVRNPKDIERVPGGSSGGSAAAVVADMALGALGSDTGGSIRLPASFCGAVGMKPTYGKVSRFGLMAMASSLDQIGPFGKTVADAEEIYSVIKGADKMDSTSKEAVESQMVIKDGSIVIGIPKEFLSGEGLDKDTAKVMDETINLFRSSGIKIKEISLPNSKYAVSVYYIIMFAEVATNLAKFDGVRYSRGGDENDTLLEIYTKTRGDGFGDEVKRRILMGTFVLSAGYYDAYYAKADKVRGLIKNDFVQAFSEVDAILSPVSPTVPFKLGEKTSDPLKMYLSDMYTIPVNLAGLPAISIPAKGREDKLPVGIQLIGQRFRDSDLFRLGKFYEQI